MPKQAVKNVLKNKVGKSLSKNLKSVKKGGNINTGVNTNVCNTNSFMFAGSCINWVHLLSLIGLIIAVVMICLVIYEDNFNQTQNNNYDSLVSSNETNFNNYKLKNLNNLGLSNLFNYSDRRNNIMNRNEYEYGLNMNNNMQNNIQEKNDVIKHHHNVDVNLRHEEPNVNNVSYLNQIHQKNHERVVNPLLPPERSYENTYGIPINIHTRGSSGGFQQVGMLYKNEISNETDKIGNNTDTVVLPLFGKPIYPGSNKWNYYVTSDKYNMVKMPITHNGRKCDADYGCDELYTNDQIQLPAYNGSFKVEIYDYDKPRYIPYIY